MTAYPVWTPAPRPGIVPLHPFGFGTILGRSFTALRQNPAVLLGFALCVQAVAYIVLIVAVGGVAFASFVRLETLTPGTEDWDAVVAGSIALTAVTGIVLTIAAGALSVIVQGIVVTEVSAAVVAEKRTLGALWRRVRPAAWRLIGWSFLLTAALVLAFALVAGIIVAIGFAVLPLGIVLGVIALVGSIPLSLWLSTKLLLVPAAIVLEGAGIGRAVGRSWQLTRGRFWPTLGVIVIVQLIFGTLAQLVAVPLQFVAMGLSTVVSPTGDPEVGAIVGVLVTAVITQILTILVQCIALIVQSTATTLIYVDCRMRAEGLDLDLLAYVEQRDGGGTDLADPYRVHVGRTIAPRPPAPVGPPYPGAPPVASAPGGYPPYGSVPPAWGPGPGAPVPGPGAPAAAPVVAPQPAAAPTSPPATQWTAPGAAPTERP